MGLSWQQGPLASRSVGTFLTAAPLPERLLFAEPLRRRMRVQLDGQWIADSEDVVLLHEPGHYPVAFFPVSDIRADVLEPSGRVTQHRELGATTWFTVTATEEPAERSAWQYTDLPDHAALLANRVAFAWRKMDAFYEEDERILGHAADAYHRIDIRSTTRHLVVRQGDKVIAETHTPTVLYESGFAPRWYVDRKDVALDALRPLEGQTFCPYKGLASYYSVGGVDNAAWAYEEAFTEVRRIDTMISFEADLLEIYLDGIRQSLAPGQLVTAHGVDRALDPDELRARTRPAG
ncbi:DUF427 domain-containing protein [Promicromonospora sp. CA-289599]|uniref:DUF427 domain-containing protein n=1 Tax=Promicromonospora sp. CA-289599 TaxID=3240014 RepID=UPI003D8D2900